MEVQRTIWRTDGIVGPSTALLDNKGLIDVIWRGELKCIGSQVYDADLLVLNWKKVCGIHQEGTSLQRGEADIVPSRTVCCARQ